MSDEPNGVDIKVRQGVAGRFGFVMGCVAAVGALVLNLWRTARPYSVLSIAVAVLMAALNVPLGIGLALLAERISRPSAKD